MNTMFCSRLPGASLYCCNLSFTHPSNIRTVPLSHSQIRIPQRIFSQLKLHEDDIAGMPVLEHSIKQSIHFFKKRGFTDLQIAKIMRLPRVIGCPEAILESKLQVFEDFGFVDENLRNFFYRSQALCLDLENNLIPKLEFLKDLYQSEDDLVKALLSNPRMINPSLEKTLKPSLAFWEGWGFSRMELLRFFKINAFVLTRTSLSPAQLDLINKIGVDKKKRSYLHIVNHVAVSRVETLEAKIENLKLCGLSAEQTWQVIRSYPYILRYSKENVRAKINFMFTKMDITANFLVKHPSLLQMSLGKTSKPWSAVCEEK